MVPIILVATGACASNPEATPGTQAPATAAAGSRRSIMEGLADRVLGPAYRRVAESAAALQAEIERSCTGTVDAARLDAIQAAWKRANLDWQGTDAYRFGLAGERSVAAAIDFAIDPDKIDALLAGTTVPTPITAERLGDAGADVRGLNGIEHVVFAPSAPADLDARRCSYAQAAATLVATAAAEVNRTWLEPTDGQPSFRDQFTQPGPGGTYVNEQVVLADVLNDSVASLSMVADMGLGRASGDINGTPQPEVVDGGRSHTLLDDQRVIIEGVQAVFLGAAPGEGTAAGSGGLDQIVRSQSAETATKTSRQLTSTLAAIAAIPAPLAAVSGAAVATVHTAYEEVKALRVTYRTEIASQLGVTLNFSDSDGDS